VSISDCFHFMSHVLIVGGIHSTCLAELLTACVATTILGPHAAAMEFPSRVARRPAMLELLLGRGTMAMLNTTVTTANAPASAPDRTYIPILHLNRRDAGARGANREINSRIACYLNADGIDELYGHALDRMERLAGRAVMSDILTALLVSRRGLSREELASITGRRRRNADSAINALSHHLHCRDEIFSLSESLRRAVEIRYAASAERRRESRFAIAEYFATQPLTPRRLEEQPWQLHAAGAIDSLAAALADMTIPLALHESDFAADLARYWSAIARGGDLLSLYESQLETRRGEEGEELRAAALYQLLGEFHRERGEDESGEALLRRSLAIRLALLGAADAITMQTARLLSAHRQIDRAAAGSRPYRSFTTEWRMLGLQI
jgi:hypothetical protein